MPMTARFITLEGGEGAGKSTQLALLADALRAAGQEVRTTREPGGTPAAEEIRALFVRRAARWRAETDALLVNAARAEHVAGLIRPALAAGQTVLCDRYVHSTLAYQGHGAGMARNDLLALHRLATGDLWPDLVLWLDLPVDQAFARTHIRDGRDGQRFESLDVDFHQRVRAGFVAEARLDPRIHRIDASQSIAAVAAQIAEVALG